MIIAEALDALWTLAIAGGVWFLIGAAVLALVLTIATITLYAAVRASVDAVQRLARIRRHPRPSWTRTGRTARRYARTRTRYDEAA
ncbi:hypothetical protein ABTX71_12865 [Streptomyces parvulus]|uniref:hypothetical protein n=1 Tax=Streptomyces parvulus TaxID=146923 RepID=UPI0033260494